MEQTDSCECIFRNWIHAIELLHLNRLEEIAYVILKKNNIFRTNVDKADCPKCPSKCLISHFLIGSSYKYCWQK